MTAIRETETSVNKFDFIITTKEPLDGRERDHKLKAETLVGMRRWTDALTKSWHELDDEGKASGKLTAENLSPKSLLSAERSARGAALPSLDALSQAPKLNRKPESDGRAAQMPPQQEGLVGIEARIAQRRREGGLKPGAEVERALPQPQSSVRQETSCHNNRFTTHSAHMCQASTSLCLT